MNELLLHRIGFEHINDFDICSVLTITNPKTLTLVKTEKLKLNIKDALSQRLNVLFVGIYNAVCSVCMFMGKSKLYTEDTTYKSKGFV